MVHRIVRTCEIVIHKKCSSYGVLLLCNLFHISHIAVSYCPVIVSVVAIVVLIRKIFTVLLLSPIRYISFKIQQYVTGCPS